MNRLDHECESLLLQRGKEYYIFLWTPHRQHQVRSMARKWAKDPDLSFTKEDYKTICALSRSSE